MSGIRRCWKIRSIRRRCCWYVDPPTERLSRMRAIVSGGLCAAALAGGLLAAAIALLAAVRAAVAIFRCIKNGRGG